MAVIINEFEVVVEPPAGQQEGGDNEALAEAGQAQAHEPLSPFALEMVMRQRLQRQARIRAD